MSRITERSRGWARIVRAGIVIAPIVVLLELISPTSAWAVAAWQAQASPPGMGLCAGQAGPGTGGYGGERTGSLQPAVFSRQAGGFGACGAAYDLFVNRSGMVTLRSPAGLAYTSFPLAAVPQGVVLGSVTASFQENGNHLTETLARGGQTQVVATVAAYRQGITLRFAITPVSSATSTSVDFLSNGTTSLSLAGELNGWTPQTGPQLAPAEQYMRLPYWSSRAPAVNGSFYYAFAPPPMNVGLEFPAGWMGMGVVQIPDADFMGVAPSGAIEMDYPLATLAKVPDTGAGGLYHGLIRFPQLLLTFGQSAHQDLSSYGSVLDALGVVPSTRLTRGTVPQWWHQPLVDTFGQQELDHVTNFANPSGFDSAYVESFATQYQQRFGIKHFTLIIDATWQASPGPGRHLGSPRPSTRLFGGYTGMRQLIDHLHRQGIKVLLWWGSWDAQPGDMAYTMGVVNHGTIDPTSPNFPAYVQKVTQLILGNGPGDLNANGLKMDFNYAVPPAVGYPWENPSLGVGVAATYRYFSTFYHDAHQVRSNALITESIAAPQFAGVMDAVRLNDTSLVGGISSTEVEWQSRARTVSDAMPQVMIDSDGGNIDAQGALEHFLSATVYGIPDNYFLTAWANGPISASQALLVGEIQKLAKHKVPGTPVRISPGNWLSERNGYVTAQDLASTAGVTVDATPTVAVDVWEPGRPPKPAQAAGSSEPAHAASAAGLSKPTKRAGLPGAGRVVVVSAASTTVAVPLYGAAVSAVTVAGRPVSYATTPTGIIVTLQQAGRAVITLRTPPKRAPLADLALSTSAGTALVAGQATEVTASLTNQDPLALSQLRLALDVPSGWSVQPISPQDLGSLPPGATVQASWNIVPFEPSQTVVTAQIGVLATFQVSGRPGQVEAARTVQLSSPVQVSLGPLQFTAGQSTQVTAAVSNIGAIMVSQLGLTLDAPSGWSVQPSAPQAIPSIGPGSTADVGWSVVASQPTQPIASAQLGVTVTFDLGGVPSQVEALQAVQVASPVQAPYKTFASTKIPAQFGQLGGSFAIDAAGTDDWIGIDQAGIIYLPRGAGPNTTAIAEVTSQADTSPYAKAGIMVRNNITQAGQSPGYVILFVSPAHGFELEWDNNGGGFIDTGTPRGGTPTVTSYPSWVKLVKNGSTFTGYWSTNGTTWNLVGTATLPDTASTQDVGIFSTSHSTGVVGLSTFSHFTVNSSSP